MRRFRYTRCKRCDGIGYARLAFGLYTQCRRCEGTGQALTWWSRLWEALMKKRD